MLSVPARTAAAAYQPAGRLTSEIRRRLARAQQDGPETSAGPLAGDGTETTALGAVDTAGAAMRAGPVDTAGAVAPTPARALVHQTVERIQSHLDAMAARNPPKEVTVKLGHLGDVRVRIDMQGARAHVVLESSHAQATTWLRENAAAVHDGLAQRGHQNTQVEVRSSDAKQSTGGDPQSEHGEQHPSREDREAWNAAFGRRYQNPGSQDPNPPEVFRQVT